MFGGCLATSGNKEMRLLTPRAPLQRVNRTMMLNTEANLQQNDLKSAVYTRDGGN